MDEKQITLRWADGADDVSRAIELRTVVFCGEQGVPVAEELDGQDEHAMHLLAEDGSGRTIGTLRLLFSAGVAKVGRVAVVRAWRRRGVASRMLDAALDAAAERGCSSARLAAQVGAVALYQGAGFEVESAEFEQAGIVHVWMGRELTADA